MLDLRNGEACGLAAKETWMRLPLVKTAALTPQQKPLYDDMRQGIENRMKKCPAISNGIRERRKKTG